MTTTVLPCVLCGDTGLQATLLIGRNGNICLACMGDAMRAVAQQHPGVNPEAGSNLHGGRRCLLCDASPADWRVVAHRGPYCICGDCLRQALEIRLSALGERAGLSAITF